MFCYAYEQKLLKKPAPSCDLAKEPRAGCIIVHCATQRGIKMHDSRKG